MTSYSSKKNSKIYQDDVPISNIYAPNTRSSIFIKETSLKFKLHIGILTMRVEDLNTQFLPTDSSSRQKLNREILEITDKSADIKKIGETHNS